MLGGEEPIDRRIHIDLAEDEMHAWLRIVPGEPVGAEELRAALVSAGVVFGIDGDALARIERAAREPSFACEPIVVAHGRPMLPARAAACTLSVPVGLQPGHELDDGSFDYRDRGLLTPVVCGQVVARCEPPMAGSDGHTVTDRVIAHETARGTDLTFGPGLARDPGGEVVATRDGVLHVDERHVLGIDDHYIHRGDVDLHSGHLDMHGALTILGDVTAKFEAHATGDIRIERSIARGSVYAGASLSVKGGIIGGPRSQVLAEGNVAAEHAQGATIRCGGTLHLRRTALNCDVRGHAVRVDGVARGGWIHAETVIVVGEAGASGVTTVLAVGEVLSRPLRPQFDEGRREQRAADRMGAAIAHDHHDELRVRRVIPATELAKAHVDVLGTIHPGTIVVVGPHRLLVDRRRRHVRFTLDLESHSIRIEPLA